MSNSRLVAVLLPLVIACGACSSLPAVSSIPTSSAATPSIVSNSEIATIAPSETQSAPDRSGSPSETPQSSFNAEPAVTPDATAPATPRATGYTVLVPPGIHPHWTADQAVAVAMHLERGSIEIISVEVMRGKDVPQSLAGPDPDVPLVWVVHAHGTFINAHGYSTFTWTEAWLIFDDRNGDEFAVTLGGDSTPVNISATPVATL